MPKNRLSRYTTQRIPCGGAMTTPCSLRRQRRALSPLPPVLLLLAAVPCHLHLAPSPDLRDSEATESPRRYLVIAERGAGAAGLIAALKVSSLLHT